MGSTAMTDVERKAAIDATLEEFAKGRKLFIADVREVWSERAGIREYLGGLRHRRNAELHAVADTMEWFSERRRLC
jgi:hypothetical protein